MPHSYDSTGVKIGGGVVVPDGEYELIITNVKETTSKAGDYQVVVDLEVVDGPHKGHKVRFHRVTFFTDPKAKAAFVAILFLKAIGEPHEGKLDVDPNNWINKTLMGYLVEDEYNGLKKNI